MTRSDLLTKLSRRTNKNTTLDTVTQNRLVDFLNERNRRIASMPGTERLRAATVSVASVASTARIAVTNAHRVNRVYETTNDRLLEPMSLDVYRAAAPNPASVTGTPTHYVLAGTDCVAKQPAASGTLYGYSTAADDTTQTLYVEGVDSNNKPNASFATLTGTTPVSMGTYIRVDRWYLSAVTEGHVGLSTSTSTSDEIGRIAANTTEARYLVILLWPTPSAAITYQIDIARTVTDFAQSTDGPDLPDDWHDLVLLGALMDEYQHMADSRYEVARKEYTERLQQFRYWLATNGGQPQAGMTSPPSRLGAYYPAGT